MWPMARVNSATWSFSCFSRCSTIRSAVFLPIPGSFENALTASSISFEEKINDEPYLVSVIVRGSSGVLWR